MGRYEKRDTCPRCGGKGSLAHGPALRKLRMGRDLGLISLAKSMGIGLAYLSKLERGDKPITAEIETRYLAALREAK